MPSLDSLITFSTLAALVQFGIIISVILRVMLTRHPPGSAFAWILITTLLPYFGFILYLLFGERPIGQLRATRFRKHLAHLKELSRQKLTPTGPLPRHLARHRTLIHLATRMGNLPVTSGTEIRLLSSSDDTFAAIISDIEAACSSIDMEFYIWHPGGEADKVAASLLKAHERGVRVRILVDDFGSRAFLKSDTCRAFRNAGIEVAKAMPMRLLHFFGLQRVDLRLHRKTIIIDNEDGDYDEDAVMMDALDAGADDFNAEDNVFEITTDPDAFNDVVKALEEKNYAFVSADISLVPQTYVKLESDEDIKNMEKLLDMLDDNEDVQNTYHNWDQD